MSDFSTLSRQPLLDWYDRHRRDLPWRAAPGAKPDPYHVWLSEMMLQQTTVATVRGYFADFLARWPNIRALAAATLDDVLAAWAGLGYYARARNLYRCAHIIVAEYGGHFPSDETILRTLPGIGPYTAAAIAAIAFDRPATVIDGNVERVLTRLAALSVPIRDNKPRIRALAEDLFHRIDDPAQPRSGDFAQGMMDLGATICTPLNPACLSCPWQEDCAARQQGIAAMLPVRSEKKPLPQRYGLHVVVIRDGAVLLQRRPPKGLLGGMLGLPGTLWRAEEPDLSVLSGLIGGGDVRPVAGFVRHRFTHFDLEARMVCAEDVVMPPDDSEWVGLADLDQVALPTVFAKMMTHVLKVVSVKG